MSTLSPSPIVQQDEYEVVPGDVGDIWDIAAELVDCEVCEGSSYVLDENGRPEDCPFCNGVGKSWRVTDVPAPPPCEQCHGERMVMFRTPAGLFECCESNYIAQRYLAAGGELKTIVCPACGQFGRPWREPAQQWDPLLDQGVNGENVFGLRPW